MILDTHCLCFSLVEKRSCAKGAMICCLKGDSRVPRFSIALEKGVVYGGEEHLVYFQPPRSWSDRKLKEHKPKKLDISSLRKKKKTILTCATRVSVNDSRDRELLFVGSSAGDIAFFIGKKFGGLVQSTETESITCLTSVVHNSEPFVVTGDAKGNVVLYNVDLTYHKHADISVRRVCSLDYSSGLSSGERNIRSKITGLVFESMERYLVLSTGSSELIKIGCEWRKGKLRVEKNSGMFLTRGHFKEEVWGLAYYGDLVATGGDDGTVRVIDSKKKRQISCTMVGNRCRALSFDSRGTTLVVGLGGRFGGNLFKRHQERSKDVGVIFFRVNENGTLSFEKQTKFSSHVSCIKFSPDDNFVAAGCQDGFIRLIGKESGKTVTKLKIGSSRLNHLDFSCDSNFIKTNDASYEILFAQLRHNDRRNKVSLKHFQRSKKLKDTDFATRTCPFDWATQGIWESNSGFDGTDINAIAVRKKEDKEGVLAAATDEGLVKLYSYPLFRSGQAKVLKGHSSHVTNVAFSRRAMFSTGGHDRCVFQWKL